MPNDFLILANLKVYGEQKVLPNACVVIRDKVIHSIISVDELNKFPNAKIIEFPESYHLLPGFIDLHIHGANGSDVMDATPEALKNIAEALAKEGTTSFLATTMSESLEKIENALKNVDKYIQMQAARGAKILGVHLEGPFLAEKKAGAQQAKDLLNPDIAYIQKWQTLTSQVIKLVTVAPELPGAMDFIKELRNKGVRVSIGHTDADLETTQAAIDAGCTQATHLFNAMSGIHHRNPGAALAALLSDKVSVELIADGVHLHPAIMQLVLKTKTKDKILLVTDAMRAKCLCDGEYDLGGQTVTVKKNHATLANGVLAGSVLKMNSALYNFIQLTNCSLWEAMHMTSINPAKCLGVFEHKGSIATNKDADLVILDDNLNVIHTFCEGETVFSNHKISYDTQSIK